MTAILIIAGLSLCLFLYSAYKIKKSIPSDSRDFMDPLPPSLKLIWPFVKLVAYYLGERLSIEYLEKIGKKLQISGVSYILTPEEYFGVRIISSIACTLFMLLVCTLLESMEIMYLLYSALFGYFLPLLTLNDLKKKRQLAIVKSLPVYLDFITMSVEAGLNLTGGLSQAVDKGPEGPLKVEFGKVLRDLRAGVNKIDAFRAMADRVQTSEVNSLVSSLAQAERTGASLGATLKVQSDQRRVERFQRAEKKALEAPVKLVFPLIMFIFPVTFMILFFPIVMKFMYDL
ncbi:type II secretion system F family protein [Pseudoalteromonas distincta]|uniref:type II secretion system F family protein n=1 Tax=Pseudoalteromonas distincta TaxID=77608 RepID=UPI00186A0EE2|nr:type II secretion system F family protein [Pseudoalteromonas distincta]MBE3674058.1 tight adherence protein C [Pseudoalteromonas distincta KMM 3548]MDC3211245.1 type II secretion system F family protein [Pseudoalteromonas distincta]